MFGRFLGLFLLLVAGGFLTWAGFIWADDGAPPLPFGFAVYLVMMLWLAIGLLGILLMLRGDKALRSIAEWIDLIDP
jgi:cytochrome c oxidase assembly factor CtaG